MSFRMEAGLLTPLDAFDAFPDHSSGIHSKTRDKQRIAGVTAAGP